MGCSGGVDRLNMPGLDGSSYYVCEFEGYPVVATSRYSEGTPALTDGRGGINTGQYGIP
jgi:hypothetical protein